MASARVPRCASHSLVTLDADDLLPRAAARATPRFDGAVLRRGQDHRRVLPAGVPRAHAAARALRVLSHRGRGRARRLSRRACAAVPSSRPATRALDAASRTVARALRRASRAARSNERERRRAGARARRRARATCGARCERELGVSPIELAQSRASRSPSSCSHDTRAADDRDRVRRRLPERAPLQRRVPRALRPAAVGAARARGARPRRSRRHARADARVPRRRTTGRACWRSWRRAPRRASSWSQDGVVPAHGRARTARAASCAVHARARAPRAARAASRCRWRAC